MRGTQLKIGRLIRLMLSICACLYFLTSPIFALQKTSSVTIHFENSDKDTQLALWQLPEGQTLPELETLFEKTDAELTRQYPQVSTVTVPKGETKLVLSNLPVGAIYYVREAEERLGVRSLAPFILKVDTDDDQAVYTKKAKAQKRGSYPFVKVSAQGGSLEGATFEVWKQTQKQLQPVIKGSSRYLLTSSKDGSFMARDLPFGSYVLKEITAPKGYLLSKKTIPFEVTDYSEKQAPVKVVNQPKIPPRIEIPYTGNAIMILVVLLGFALFTLGVYLVRRNG
ncbi:TPA: cell wall anchor protein [Streptococcus pyogenes]|nr:cell wall anchor protein [Streptococcus pyogenes]